MKRFEGVDVVCENCFAKYLNCYNCKNPSVVYWEEWGLGFCAECAIKANAKLNKLMRKWDGE